MALATATSSRNREPHRNVVMRKISEGGATRESLCDELDLKPASLSSVFSQLRLMGRFPMEDDDGVLHFGSEEDYRLSRAAKPKVTKSASEIHEFNVKALKRAEQECERYNPEDGEEASLRYSLAVAKVNLYSYLVDKSEDATFAESDD